MMVGLTTVILIVTGTFMVSFFCGFILGVLAILAQAAKEVNAGGIKVNGLSPVGKMLRDSALALKRKGIK